MDFRNYLFGRISRIMLFAVMMALFAVPASADSVWNNNTNLSGTAYDSFQVNHGDAVADSFTLSGPYNLTSVNFALDWWTLEQDPAPTSIDWAIGTGTPFQSFDTLYHGTQSLTNTTFTVGGLNNAWDVFEESIDLTGVSLLDSSLTYYLVLSNAQPEYTASGAGVTFYWDLSNGPSTAYYSTPDVASAPAVGCETGGSESCSETFEILGDPITTPEPATLTLLGTGLFFLVGRRRRASH